LFSARVQVTQDLLVFILKADKKVPDKDFCNYIMVMQNKYKEGYSIDANILMKLASSKFKALVQEGSWNAPLPELKSSLLWKPKLSFSRRGAAQAVNARARTTIQRP